MNSRERILATVSHRVPDRVPFDLGSTVVTGIHVRAYERLRSILGLPAEETIVLDQIQQLAAVSDDLIEVLGVDVKGVHSSPGAGWQFVPRTDGGYREFVDEFGIVWRMPVDGGFYYDMVAHPLAGDCSRADAARYPLPDPVDPARFVGLRDQAEGIAYGERRATVGKSLCAGIMETAAWLRGYEDFYADLAADPGLASALMSRILELKIAYWGTVIDVCGPALDIACEADDLGGEHSMLVSPATYRTLLKPLHRELFSYLHSRGVKVFFHCCGAIRPIIADLIDSGVDILNPVQVAAAGMDSAGLKAEFGRDVTFWGGGIDTQRVLPFGSSDDVRAEVRRRLRDLMPGGGFVFNTVHNIQADVPAENIAAMWETLREHGEYS
jgi:uroporphyrinogen decarboxylase